VFAGNNPIPGHAPFQIVKVLQVFEFASVEFRTVAAEVFRMPTSRKLLIWQALVTRPAIVTLSFA
jgi:hypothetical protein